MTATARDPAALARAAREALAHDPARALALLDDALREFPDDAGLHALRGHALRVTGDFAGAEASLRQALRQEPGHDEAAASLAHLLRNDGRYRAAAETLQRNFATRVRDGDALEATTAFLRECGADDEALALCLAHPHLLDTHAGACFVAAELLFAAGRFDEAAARLRRTVALRPGHGGAWLRLAHAQRHRGRDDADVLALLRAAAPDDDDARIAVAFARGKVLDDLGEPAGAFAHFHEGNRLARLRQPWDAAAWSRELSARIAAPRRASAARDDGATPLFLVGMPRSGTTLLASRLARHPDIAHRGELNWVGATAPHWRAAPSRDNAMRLARHVRAHLVRDDAPVRYYLDKNPLNFRDLDAIAALFPHARIVWCRRDARDTCLSIWTQHFAHPDSAFAYALPDILRYHGDHARAMASWPARLDLDHRIVDYERFIADPDAELVALWQWLGLRPSRARVDAPLSAAAARTASAWQVRQPIHRDAHGRWLRYAPFLPGLRELDPSGLGGT